MKFQREAIPHLLILLMMCVGLTMAASCPVPPETQAAMDKFKVERDKAVELAKELKDAYDKAKEEGTAENIANIAALVVRTNEQREVAYDAFKEYQDAVKEYGTGGMPAWLQAVLIILGIRSGGAATAIMAPENAKWAKTITALTGGSGLHNVGTPAVPPPEDTSG